MFIPWDHVGCDDRVGASRTIPADYTIYDLLFHEESDAHLLHAVPGLARKIQEDYGPVAATLFAFGARTPLRDLVVTSKRKDPEDTGNYEWTAADQGLRVQFWDNDKFSDWIKQLWESQETPNMIELAREGRFLGIEVDAMNTPRQTEAFFTNTAETLTTVGVLDTCAQVFQE